MEEGTDTHHPEDAQQGNVKDETLNSSFTMLISGPTVDKGRVRDQEDGDLKETEDIAEELFESHEGEANRHLECEEDHEGSLPE